MFFFRVGEGEVRETSRDKTCVDRTRTDSVSARQCQPWCQRGGGTEALWPHEIAHGRVMWVRSTQMFLQVFLFVQRIDRLKLCKRFIVPTRLSPTTITAGAWRGRRTGTRSVAGGVTPALHTVCAVAISPRARANVTTVSVQRATGDGCTPPSPRMGWAGVRTS